MRASASTLTFFVLYLASGADALFSKPLARRVATPKPRGPFRFNAFPLAASTDFETARLAPAVAHDDRIAQALHTGAFTLECALDAYRPWRTLGSFQRADSRTLALGRLQRILGFDGRPDSESETHFGR